MGDMKILNHNVQEMNNKILYFSFVSGCKMKIKWNKWMLWSQVILL